MLLSTRYELNLINFSRVSVIFSVRTLHFDGRRASALTTIGILFLSFFCYLFELFNLFIITRSSARMVKDVDNPSLDVFNFHARVYILCVLRWTIKFFRTFAWSCYIQQSERSNFVFHFSTFLLYFFPVKYPFRVFCNPLFFAHFCLVLKNFDFLTFARAHVKHSASTSWISTTDLQNFFLHSDAEDAVCEDEKGFERASKRVVRCQEIFP